MNYAEFKEKMINELASFFTEKLQGCEVLTHEFYKINKKVDAICVKHPKDNVGPTIYVEQTYFFYQMVGSFEDAMNATVQLIEEGMKRGPQTENVTQMFENPKDRIVMQLINTEKNKEYLETLPHREFLDLSIIYRLVVDIVEDGIASAIVTNDLLERMNVTEEELFRMAVTTGSEILKPRVSDMDTIAKEIAQRSNSLSAQMMAKEVMELPEDHKMYVVTNDSGVNGACVILYQNVLHELAEKLKSDLVILPSSLHECIVVASKNHIVWEDMVNQINMQEVDEMDRLSNSVYKYSRKTGQIDFLYRSSESI